MAVGQIVLVLPVIESVFPEGDERSHWKIFKYLTTPEYKFLVGTGKYRVM